MVGFFKKKKKRRTLIWVGRGMDLGGTEKRVKQDQNILYEILKGIISNLLLETK